MTAPAIDGRTARGADTHSALVRAARAVLVEEGFARASARTIAARAGCSQAALFFGPELLGSLRPSDDPAPDVLGRLTALAAGGSCTGGRHSPSGPWPARCGRCPAPEC